jgi:phage terminase large subunit-like protein
VTWSTACPDWEERIVERRSLIPLDPLFPDEAEAALAVFKSLRIVDLPGKPTFGEACDEWVFEFVAAIFGAYDAERATRLITEFLLLISKKNAKSTIAAGIMVTALIRNWRHAAELLLLAPTIEVANNSFGPAHGMVRSDPELAELLHVVEHQRLIRHRVTDAELKIVRRTRTWSRARRPASCWSRSCGCSARSRGGGDAARGDGRADQPARRVHHLSDHPFGRSAGGVFKEKLDYARDVRDGKIEDPAFLPVLYEWPEGC